MRTLLWRDGLVETDQEYALTTNLYYQNEWEETACRSPMSRSYRLN